MIRQRVKEVAHALINAVKGNSIECILAIVAVVIGVTIIYSSEHKDYRLLYYPMLFLLANTTNKLTVNHQKRWIYYAVSLLFVVALVFCNVEPSSSYYVVALGCVALAYLSFPLCSDNKLFAENVMNSVVALLFAGFVAGVVFLLVVSIKLSLNYLFDLESSSKDIEYLAMVVWVGFFPILFLAFNENSLRLTLKNKLTEILFNYILTPAIIIYMLIFYSYFIKVALQWELPKGNVAYMVFGFGIAAYLLKMVSYVLSKDYFGWLYRNLSFFVLPALILFWIGTIYRVNEYGFTEERIYLLIGGVYLTVVSLVLISRKLGRYLYLSLGVIVVLSAFTYIPFMSAKTLGIKSQVHRFEKALNSLGYTKLDSTVRFKALADTPQNRKVVSTLTSSLEYVYNNTEKGYTIQHLGVKNSYQLEKIITPVNYGMADESSPVRVLDNQISELNLQGYKTLVLLDAYSDKGNYYKNNGSRLIIYHNGKVIFNASKKLLIKSQLAKASVTLFDAADVENPLTKQQQLLLYRIEIPGGVALVSSYYINEQPLKDDEIYLYGMLLR